MGTIRKLSTAVYPYLPYLLKNFACSYEGHRLRRLRFGGKYNETLDWLKKAQWWSVEQQRSYQLKRLCHILEVAEQKVPYYGKLFKKLGFCSRDILSLEDLNNLPVLKKSDIKNSNKSFLSCGISQADLVENSTGGTTISPLQLWMTRSCMQTYFAVAWRQRSWFDVDNEMAHATFNGRTLVRNNQNRPPFWCQNSASKQTLFSIYHMKSSSLQAYVEELARFPREYLTGYPSSLHILASFLLENHIELPWWPKAIFTSSENLLENQRQVISKAFRAPVADFYGMGEQAVSASQCPYGLYHFDFEVGIVEVIPIGDDPLVGRIVCTGLLNEAMPLIRYDTQDIVRLSKKACLCGRKGLVAESIDGRMDSYIKTPEGYLVGHLAHIYTNLQGVQEAQIVQIAIDRLKLRIVKAYNFSDNDVMHLINALRDRIGASIKIEVEYLDNIPRESNGKYRSIVSQLTKEEMSLK